MTKAKADPASEAAESVGNFIDTEAETLELGEYVAFLETLLDDVRSRLSAARDDLYG